MTVQVEEKEQTNLDEQGHKPEQQELPLAIVQGAPVMELPKDLYIPPEALEVFLETFEGPLDLLLYLIKRQNIDILDIPVAEITDQYVQYVEMMQEFQFELAAEYLVMAAMLGEIKSRMLLPQTQTEEEDEGDPRAELIRRLQEYERFKNAAQELDELPRMGRDCYEAHSELDYKAKVKNPDVELSELLFAMREVMARADKFTHHNIEREILSVRERMTKVLELVNQNKEQEQQFTRFTSLFTFEEGRGGVVVTFLAILELSKQSLLEIVQNESYGLIHVRAV